MDNLLLIKEINQIEYNIQMRLRFEYDQLIDESLTDKQMIVLDLIRNHPAIHAGEIAQRLNITPSAVSQLLNALEKKNMITRTINRNNRRELCLQLTPEAIKHFANVEKLETAIIQKYYSRLTLEELAQLKAILTKIERFVLERDDAESQAGGDAT